MIEGVRGSCERGSSSGSCGYCQEIGDVVEWPAMGWNFGVARGTSAVGALARAAVWSDDPAKIRERVKRVGVALLEVVGRRLRILAVVGTLVCLHRLYHRPYLYEDVSVLVLKIYKKIFGKAIVIPPEVQKERDEVSRNIVEGKWTRRELAEEEWTPSDVFLPTHLDRVKCHGKEYKLVGERMVEVSRPVWLRMGYNDPDECGAFHWAKDGTYLYTGACRGSDDGCVRVWDLMTRACVVTLGVDGRKGRTAPTTIFVPPAGTCSYKHDTRYGYYHPGWVESLIVDNGKLFAQIYKSDFPETKIVRIWDTKTFECLGCLPIDKGTTIMQIKNGKLRTRHHEYDFLPKPSLIGESLFLELGPWSNLLPDLWSSIYKMLRQADRRALSGVNKFLRTMFKATYFSERVFPKGYQKSLETLKSKTWNITHLQFAPAAWLDGEVFYRKSGNDIERWDATTGAPLPSLTGHTAEVKDYAFDENKVFSIATNGDFFIWDEATGNATSSFKTDLTGELRIIGGRRVEKTWYICDRETWIVHVWDVELQKKLYSRELTLFGVSHSCSNTFMLRQSLSSHFQHHLIFAQADMIWMTDLSEPDPLKGDLLLPEWHKGQITAIAVHEDTLFSGSLDGEILVWDLYHLEKRPISLFKNKYPIHRCLVQNGRLHAYTQDGKMRIWDLATQKLLGTLTGGTYMCMSQEKICFRPTAGGDTLHIFDLAPEEVNWKNQVLSYFR